MAEPTPPTETRVRPPGRDVSGVVARTPPAGDGIDGTETEITFRIDASENLSCENTKQKRPI